MKLMKLMKKIHQDKLLGAMKVGMFRYLDYIVLVNSIIENFFRTCNLEFI